jgi:integrating conjugative element protein (TIGR03765 family)
MTHLTVRVRGYVLCCLGIFPLLAAADTPLIVVHDAGGVSALPYYRALNLKPPDGSNSANVPEATASTPPRGRYREADLLPVRSKRLTPGPAAHHAIRAPGLTPIFLLGDDARSREWLRTHAEKLRALHAVGFVVQVDSESALQRLRQLAPDLTLTPASGEDLAQRLGLTHYPVLLTATAIEP